LKGGIELGLTNRQRMLHLGFDIAFVITCFDQGGGYLFLIDINITTVGLVQVHKEEREGM
jgi:hypothetical protein